MRLGCCVSLKQLEAAIWAGYEFLDLEGAELAFLDMEEVRKVRERLRKAGIPCIGLHGTFPKEVSLTGRGELSLEDYLGKLLPRARVLEIHYLGVGSPKSRPLVGGRKEAGKTMRESLYKISKMAPEMEILLENLNNEEADLCTSIEECYELISDMEERRIGLLWDLYHSLKQGEEVERYPDTYWKRIRYIHIADSEGRGYPGKHTDEKMYQFLKLGREKANASAAAVEAPGHPVKDLRGLGEWLKR